MTYRKKQKQNQEVEGVWDEGANPNTPVSVSIDQRLTMKEETRERKSEGEKC